MMPDPEPLKTIRTFLRECAVVKADTGGVEHANLLKSHRGMPRVRPEKCKIFVRKLSNVVRKLVVVEPKVRVGKVVQSGVQRPAS